MQVSVEYGLCEMMNSRAIRPNVAPKDGNMRFDMAECEAMLPPGMVDKTVERVYKEVKGTSTSKYDSMVVLLGLISNFFLPCELQFPHWGESDLEAGERYKHLIKDLADKYPTQNLLLITHGNAFPISIFIYKQVKWTSLLSIFYS